MPIINSDIYLQNHSWLLTCKKEYPQPTLKNEKSILSTHQNKLQFKLKISASNKRTCVQPQKIKNSIDLLLQLFQIFINKDKRLIVLNSNIVIFSLKKNLKPIQFSSSFKFQKLTLQQPR